MLENDNKSDSEIFANLEKHRNKVSTLRTHRVPTKKTIETVPSNKQALKPNNRIAAASVNSAETSGDLSSSYIFLWFAILAVVISVVCYYAVKTTRNFENEIISLTEQQQLMDHRSISSPLRKYTHDVLAVTGLLIITLIGTGLALYKALRTKMRLKTKSQSEGELKALNQQLQTEILDRINTQETLAQERNLLRTLVDTIPDSVYAKDLQGNFVFANERCANDLGLSGPKNMIGKCDFNCMPEEIARLYYDEEQKVINTGVSLINREALYRDHINQKALLISKVPWKNAKGEIIGTIGVNRDTTNITKREKAEEDLANERNLLRTLIEAIPDSVYAKDLRGNFVFANKSCANELGLSNPKDVIGKSDSHYMPKEMALSFRDEEQKIINTGVSIINSESISHDPIKQTWGLITKVPWKNTKGKIIGIIGVNR